MEFLQNFKMTESDTWESPVTSEEGTQFQMYRSVTLGTGSGAPYLAVPVTLYIII
jgi:hypothetical protein